MDISEEKLKKEYDKYTLEKTKPFDDVVAIILAVIVLIFLVLFIYLGVSIGSPILAIVLVVVFLVGAKILDVIANLIIKANKKAVCLSYEKWASEYLKRGNMMQSYNQSASTFNNKNTYDTEILPYTIRAKITELQNQIDANEIVNRNLPMFEKLLQQKVLVTAQKQIIELEIQKIPLYQQERENQIYMTLIAQRNEKKKTIENIENQLNRLQ
jgi:hypothetical protein